MVSNPSIAADTRPAVEQLDQFAKRSDVAAALRQAHADALQRLQRDPALADASVALDLPRLAQPVPAAVGSIRVVVTRTAGLGIVERHANSTQYLLVLDGPVQTHVQATGGWRIDHYGEGDCLALEDRWHVVPPGTWHRTLAAGRLNWGIVAFHSAADVADEFQAI